MTKHTPEVNPERQLPLQEKVSRVLQSLARGSFAKTASDIEMPGKADLEVSEEALDRIIHEWRERPHFVPGDLLADPAWAMLLELLQAECQDRQVSLPGLCEVSAVPASSAARWLKALEQRGLIVRRAASGDPKDEFVELSSKGSTALRRYFRDVVQTV